jgi:hypothetical protein
MNAILAALPWGDIIKFLIDMVNWWKEANEEKKKKMLKLLEVISDVFKKGGSADDVTIVWDTISRL